jgi:hypothetical protein
MSWVGTCSLVPVAPATAGMPDTAAATTSPSATAPTGITHSRTRCQRPLGFSRALPSSCRIFVVLSGVRRETSATGAARVWVPREPSPLV